MVHDILEAINKSGFSDYNKEIQEFIQQLIKSNNDKSKAEKKKENTSGKRIEMENDDDIKNEENNEKDKEKII